MFEVGDKVKRIASTHMDMNYGDISVVTGFGYSNCVKLKDFKGEHASRNLKLVEEKPQFDLKKNPWFIRTGTKEEFEAAACWLKSNGIVAKYGESWVSYLECVRSADYHNDDKFIRSSMSDVSNHKEIKLTYKTLVESVTYPVVETEQDKKIKELKETIDKAQQQLEEMMGK